MKGERGDTGLPGMDNGEKMNNSPCHYDLFTPNSCGRTTGRGRAAWSNGSAWSSGHDWQRERKTWTARRRRREGNSWTNR